MSRRLRPSLTALQTFEAAARLGSFRRASDELSLTQSAISRQIRGLEAMLGIRLFELVRQRVVLTELGARYLIDVRRTIDGLEESTLRVMALAGGAEIINLATLPTFGSRWLIPRLPSFLTDHPGAIVNFTTRLSPFDFTLESFDAAIHFGLESWPGAVMTRLLTERMVPVCSPDFRSRHGIKLATDLSSLPLLQQTTRPTAWTDWFGTIGESSENAERGARFDQFTMLTQAAISGLGAALLPEFLIEEELRTRRLMVIGDQYLETDQAYYLVVPEGKTEICLIDEFRKWIVAAARGRPSIRGDGNDRA